MTSMREGALAELGLSARPDADRAEILRAFERLARRYPPRSFPERFQRIIEARDLLLGDERHWRAEVEGRTLDLSWLLRYLPEDPLSTLGEPAARDQLQAFLRAAYRGLPLKEDEDDEQGMFERMLEAMVRRLGRS